MLQNRYNNAGFFIASFSQQRPIKRPAPMRGASLLLKAEPLASGQKWKFAWTAKISTLFS